MQLGIFAKTFARPTLEGVFDAVRQHGFDCVQFNMACAGLAPMPEEIEPGLVRRIGEQAKARGIRIAALSGTFNMIHPDAGQRRIGLKRLKVVCAACRELGAEVITLCTGTRDPDNMWRRHPENDSAEAWRDLVGTMDPALAIAEEQEVMLAVEPEVSNVIDSAVKARRLLDEMGSPRLKVIMDGANLFHAGELPRMGEILDEAFALLGGDVVLAHAKDLSRDGDAGHEAAGTGLLDYDRYIGLMRKHMFDGPLILHGLSEAQVPVSAAFVRGKLAARS